ncbi:MAG: 23S rRNA (adenine(2503)-C(2))-methyltransferase RlmN [Clostridiales bacterium]|jgi:23S rRNA (adenine2503-C2)-methyltransferase|nr:23S rRNA (adenine(2503)-C(2))-methyltransferase RlmN [Clostridiales bacterium]
MKDILSMNFSEIEGLVTESGQPKYRAEQIFDWLHRRGAKSFDEMENLPKTLRNELENHCYITNVSVEEKFLSKNDETEKYLLKLGDAYVESVRMKYKHGNSVCISTQAGCKMGCKFCASAESGFYRNLSAGEMCAQVYNAAGISRHSALDAKSPGITEDNRGFRAKPAEIRNVVLMGCGEPLDNFDATLRFIELITHPNGMNISQRNITVSTCGLVPQIHALAKKELQINLAISLHAPTDEIREKIMPIAKTFPQRELISACRFYTEKTRRRITFEYALSKGLNDIPAHAKFLAKLLHGLLCHVNLIPINKARGNFSPTPRRDIEIFASILKEKNIPTTIRRSLGNDINAACGQLRLRRKEIAICPFHHGK